MPVITDELRLIIQAEVDRAIRDMERFDDQIEKTEEKAKAAAVNWDKVSRSMMIFSGVVAAGGIAAGKFAADIEAQETAFGVLLGSVERGTKLFAELKQFSAPTPLQLQDITRGAQTLMAFGTEAGKVQTTLRMLGDAAMGNAGKLDTLVRAYGKLQAKGRASLEELNMFTEAGVPLMDQLARQTGSTTEEVFALVSSGQIGFKDVEAALQALTGEGGKFEGMMEKISQTTTGKLSTAIDNLKLSAAELGKILLPTANNILDKVTKAAQWFTALDDATKKWIVTLGGVAVAAGPISKIATGLHNVYKNKQAILGIAKNLGPVITNPWVLAGAAVATLTIASIKLAQTWRRTRNVIEGGSTGDLGKDLEILAGQVDAARRKVEELEARKRGAGTAPGLVAFNQKDLDNALANLENLQARHQEVYQQFRADKLQVKIEAGEILWLEDVVNAAGAAGDAQVKAWQAWFNEIAGTSLDAGTKTGSSFATAYLNALRTGVQSKAVLAEAMGVEFNAAKAEAESIKGVLEKLFAIDVSQIDDPFAIMDESVKPLLSRYLELMALVEESGEKQLTLFEKLYSKEEEGLQDKLAATQAYGQINEEITAAMLAGDTRRLSILGAVKEELETILGIQKESQEVAENIGPLEAKFFENWAPEEQATRFGSAARKIMQSYDLMKGKMEEWAFAIDIVKDAWNTISETIQNNLAVDLETMRMSADAEYEILQKNLNSRESLYNEEISALKELYDKDVISYEDYLLRKAGVDGQYTADKEAEAKAYVEMQNAYLKAKYAADVSQFEANKKAALAQAVIAGAMGIIQAWALGPIAGLIGSAVIVGAVAAQVSAINKQAPPPPPQYITAASVTAATGADFITAGPTHILAGDNPGGKERVQITPLSSPNLKGPRGGNGDIYYISIGNLVGRDGMDEFIEKLDTRKKQLSPRGAFA